MVKERKEVCPGGRESTHNKETVHDREVMWGGEREREIKKDLKSMKSVQERGGQMYGTEAKHIREGTKPYTAGRKRKHVRGSKRA